MAKSSKVKTSKKTASQRGRKAASPEEIKAACNESWDALSKRIRKAIVTDLPEKKSDVRAHVIRMASTALSQATKPGRPRS